MCTCPLFVQLQFSHDDRCFFPSNEGLGQVADCIGLLHRAERQVVRGCEGEVNTTLFLVDVMVAAVVCGRRLGVQWLEEARRDAGGLESLPDFISLPRDEEGRPIIPTSRVTALVETKGAWATELGTLAAVTRSITRGQLVMLLIGRCRSPPGGGTGPVRVRTGRACCAVGVVRPSRGLEEDATGPPAEART